jgi:1-acyl-sn-glycerol-3-phosphate acyltransferase
VLLPVAGAVFGCAAAAVQRHPRRCLGLVPVGATGMLLAIVWGRLAGDTAQVPCFLLGFMGGLVAVPLRATYLAVVPADCRGNAAAVMNATVAVAAAVPFVTLWLAQTPILPSAQLVALANLTAAGTILAWIVLYPQAMETAVEILLLPTYRIRVHGPGADRLPGRGPLLIVSNHSAYLDPFWIAKVVPRQIRPMMTSAFYDLPVVSWLSRHVARAIRVPTGVFRREAPELQEAIAALRAGECVAIFPEGMLRRSEEELARPFGRGVWHVLHELPDTPVCVCWVEGSWGSYFSYKDGPPGKNKRRDRGRPIDIAFGEPRPVSPDVLASHHATRAWLRRAVLECRGHLGLAVPAPDAADTAEEPAAEPRHDDRPTAN